MRAPVLRFVSVLLFSGLVSACTQKMGTDGHMRPYEEPRRFPPETVARGHLKSPFDNPTLVKNPLPVTAALLTRGRERFNIYCAPCHGESGYGNGMIVQRGFVTPPSYHSAALKALPDGAIYGVITNGFGRMFSYSDRVSIEDRWAIVAYIRALQLSQGVPVAKLSDSDRAALQEEAQ